jgi:hypothetical protein
MKKLQSMVVAVFCLTLVLLICGANTIFAQDVTGSVTGTVTDPSGAAVAGATVTAKSVERGITYTGVTNEAGIYRIAQLPVGNYDLRIEMNGFQTALYPTFVLHENQIARFDAGSKITALVLGWVEDSVFRSDSRVLGVAGSFVQCAFASTAW